MNDYTARCMNVDRQNRDWGSMNSCTARCLNVDRQCTLNRDSIVRLGGMGRERGTLIVLFIAEDIGGNPPLK